jgi:phospholipid/cholesterol/gamma-HCH transport system substrate-binding protein
LKISKEFKTGLTFIGVIIIFIWGYSFLKGNGIFHNKKFYYVVYDQAVGLAPTSPVFIRGLQVGKVSDVFFHKNMNGSVVVKLNIVNQFPIPNNSVATIINRDLMGAKAIEIILGDSPHRAQPGDTLAGAIDAGLLEGLNRQLTPVMQKAELALNSIDSTMKVLQVSLNHENRENISKSLQSIQFSLRNIKQITATLDTLILSNKSRVSFIIQNIESISANLESNNEQLTAVISNIHTISDTLAQVHIEQTFKKLDYNLELLSEILIKIERGEGSAGLLLSSDSLYDNLSRSTKELELLIRDIRENPSRYLKFSVF